VVSAIPLVSIIIPVHNAAKYIENTCSRILTEMIEHPLELILVENGSTDNSLQVMNALKLSLSLRTDVDIIILRSQAGLGNALSMGVKNSNGDVIYVTGDDLPFGTNDFKDAIPYVKPDTFVIGSKLHARSCVSRGCRELFSLDCSYLHEDASLNRIS
jgi:dolichyl-phosphate beta-glucosyltransferase